MEKLTLDDIKETELELLKAVDEFCQLHRIKYFIHAGTLLGAVRHGGFIPWDDDIDIIMPRHEYEKFRVLTKRDDCPFGYICFEENKDYPYAFAKVFSRETLLIENDRKGSSIGIYIDVFPLDNLPNVKEKAIKFVKYCHTVTWVQMMASDKKIRHAKTRGRQIAKVIITPFSKLIGYKRLTKILNKKVQKYNNEQTHYIGNLVSPNYMHVYEKEWFKEAVRIPFETIEVNAPVGYKELLHTMYDDYMKLPPEEKRVSHHDFEVYRK